MQISYRTIDVEPEKEGFGASIYGPDLAAPLPAETLADINAAWARHSVLAFPSQPLTHAQLENFTLQLGQFGVDPFIKPMKDHPHILEIRREPDEVATNFGAGWHSDWSFQEMPPAGTILHAKVTPPIGGDTLFADCYRAYESLSDAMKKLLDGLVAVHSAALPYGTNGLFAQDKDQRTMQIIVSKEAEKTWPHPLVRTHPVTGCKALFASPVYTMGLEGMTSAESASLMNYLYEHITQEKFIYRHRWQPDMLLLWDNRCTLHFAEGGYDGYRRVMHRTTIAGDRPV